MRKFQLLFLTDVTARMPRVAAFGIFFYAISLCAVARDASHAPVLHHEIIATHPHDTRAFTQGLAILNGQLIESTGRYGQSALALKNLATGEVIKQRPLSAHHFGEGVTVAGSRLIQLTWTSGVAWIYDFALKRRGQFRYDGQGWGLAYDGQYLLMSDGSSRITFRRPTTFEISGGVDVRDGNEPLRKLNELEFAEGWLYANVWQTDRIAVIDPQSGAVRGWLDLASLRQGMRKPPGWDEREHVLNGIAFNPANGHFYVTGKCWPVLFELKIEKPAGH